MTSAAFLAIGTALVVVGLAFAERSWGWSLVLAAVGVVVAVGVQGWRVRHRALGDGQ